MDRDEIIASAEKFTQESPGNYISDKIAINPNCSGMKIFDSPIFAFGSADDELYEKYKAPDVIGSHFLSPCEWLPGAKTIISYFLPFTERIRSANASNYHWPADEWLHGRIEGQLFITELSIHLQKLLSDAGYRSLVPVLDTRFKIGSATVKFTSNWSERHVAFACGLGAFGLSKGMITKKGTCGRLGSIVTELDLPNDDRLYQDIYEYCDMCGLCIPHCPAHSISFEGGKKDSSCSDFLDKVLKKHNPRYACGKCQVNVPCESKAPKEQK